MRSWRGVTRTTWTTIRRCVRPSRSYSSCNGRASLPLRGNQITYPPCVPSGSSRSLSPRAPVPGSGTGCPDAAAGLRVRRRQAAARQRERAERRARWSRRLGLLPEVIGRKLARIHGLIRAGCANPSSASRSGSSTNPPCITAWSRSRSAARSRRASGRARQGDRLAAAWSSEQDADQVRARAGYAGEDVDRDVDGWRADAAPAAPQQRRRSAPAARNVR